MMEEGQRRGRKIEAEWESKREEGLSVSRSWLDSEPVGTEAEPA